MSTIHRKTPKGRAEIETRAHRLPPRLRSALILVDGRRSDAELAKLVPQDPEGTLQALREGGFIEAVAVEAAPPAPAAAAPAAAGPPFEQLRREAVRALTDLVGPLAEALALKMEKARSPEELRPLLALAVQIVGNTRGRQMAADYGRRFGVEDGG
jgi:3-oxoacyl-ACP reductase-like protein